LKVRYAWLGGRGCG